jgi:hypothetical protein
MRNIEEYFRITNLPGAGQGGIRRWDLSIYSEGIRQRVYDGLPSNGAHFDEWQLAFF